MFEQRSSYTSHTTTSKTTRGNNNGVNRYSSYNLSHERPVDVDEDDDVGEEEDEEVVEYIVKGGGGGPRSATPPPSYVTGELQHQRHFVNASNNNNNNLDGVPSRSGTPVVTNRRVVRASSRPASPVQQQQQQPQSQQQQQQQYQRQEMSATPSRRYSQTPSQAPFVEEPPMYSCIKGGKTLQMLINLVSKISVETHECF